MPYYSMGDFPGKWNGNARTRTRTGTVGDEEGLSPHIDIIDGLGSRANNYMGSIY
jgi:hypothetical protein